MKTLLLLRHGEAAPAQAGQKDQDRPLTMQGRAAMHALGERLVERGLMPQYALCSGAVRTQQTFLAVTGGRPEIRTEILPGLYNAGTESILDFIALFEEMTPMTGMIVGHNPNIHEVARMLALDGDDAQLQSLQAGFPPGTLAVLECPVDDWFAIPRARNRLIDLLTP